MTSFLGLPHRCCDYNFCANDNKAVYSQIQYCYYEYKIAICSTQNML